MDTLDATMVVAAYKAGFEAAFMMLNDDSELESELNCNGIVTKNDEDNDEV